MHNTAHTADSAHSPSFAPGGTTPAPHSPLSQRISQGDFSPAPGMASPLSPRISPGPSPGLSPRSTGDYRGGISTEQQQQRSATRGMFAANEHPATHTGLAGATHPGESAASHPGDGGESVPQLPQLLSRHAGAVASQRAVCEQLQLLSVGLEVHVAPQDDDEDGDGRGEFSRHGAVSLTARDSVRGSREINSVAIKEKQNTTQIVRCTCFHAVKHAQGRTRKRCSRFATCSCCTHPFHACVPKTSNVTHSSFISVSESNLTYSQI